MGYLKVTTSDTRMKAKVTPLPRSGEVNLRARRLAPPPANGKTHLPGADQLALAQIAQRFAPGKPRSRGLRSREPAASRRRRPEIRDPATGAAGAERSGRCCADPRFAAWNANADRRAHPRCAPAERAVRRHDRFRRDTPELARALAQDASSDLAFGACFGRRCPSAGETTSSARAEVRAEACRRDGQCSARAPRAAKCSRGGSWAKAGQDSDRWASARSESRGGGHGID